MTEPTKGTMQGTLSDRVSSELLRRIAAGEPGEGEALASETRLAAEFGVSRSVAREALRTLAAKGFVESSQGAATVVAPRYRWQVLDPDFLSVSRGAGFLTELQEARELIEPRLARLAALRADAGLTQRLDRLTAVMAEVGATDPERHADLDIAFHAEVAAASGNPVLASVHNSLSIMGRRSRVTLVAVPGAVDRAVEWHRHILAAVADRQPDSAEAAMLMHLSQVRGELESLVPTAQEADLSEMSGSPGSFEGAL